MTRGAPAGVDHFARRYAHRPNGPLRAGVVAAYSQTMLAVGLRTVLGLAVAMAVLFLPAGTLNWPRGWVYLGLYFGCSLAMTAWLALTDQGLLQERMRSPASRDQAPEDRRIALALLFSFAAWHVFMALDAKRFHWSSATGATAMVGGALVVLSFAGWTWVLAANRFAASTIRAQSERTQVVIETGPYALVRHPMYAAALLGFVGAPLLLGSLWGLAWLPLFIIILTLRARREEALLRVELAGYTAYAARVRIGILPGVW
jgi:protein-S-isoprenylcysteine O-methyltransferase Ste14